MRFVVSGCGRVGSTLARTLRLRGHDVVAIDPEPARLARLPEGLRKTAIAGNPLEQETLGRAQLSESDGIAAVSDSDDENLVVALAARRLFRVPRAVARLHDPSRAQAFRRLGVESLSPIVWGVNRVADLLCHSPLERGEGLGTGQVELVEAGVPAFLEGQRAGVVVVPGEIHLVAVTRAGETFLGNPEARLHRGDRLHLAVLSSAAERLTSLLAGT